MLINIIIGLVLLSVLIIAHELGHFVTAKASGVKVEEFGIGFPPRLISVKHGETRYSLNAIPMGGFNKMAGEEDPRDPGSLASKSIGTRLLVLSAGSLVNIILPVIMLSSAFMIPHNAVFGQVTVEEVAPDSPAARAGIAPGDILLGVNQKPVNNVGDLVRRVQLNLGKEITVTVKHSDATVEEVQLVPRWKPPEGQGPIGTLSRTVNPTTIKQHYPFWQAIPMGIGECIEVFILSKNGIISMALGAVPLNEMTLVGVAQMTGEVARTGLSPLLEYTALISLILGIGNLFPLPALDGGRIAFVLLEWVRRGKRVPPKTEGLVHLVGFALLMALTLAVIGQDIIRIFSGESLLP